MKSALLGLMVFMAACGPWRGAHAEGLDGTVPAICATNETFDCAPNGDCIRDSPEGINLPRFIRLDFAAKRALTKRLSGEERVAEIRSQQVEEGRIILQGVQAAHGWSLAISQETGAMSLTVVGDGVAFVVFGVCTTL